MGGIEINTRQLVQLKVGDVLPIDRNTSTIPRAPGERAQVLSPSRQCGNTWAVELTQSTKG